MSKAFNVDSQRILFAKLVALGMSDQAVGWTHSLLYNRSFLVRTDEVVSQEAAIPTEIHHSVIGSIPFKPMVNDLHHDTTMRGVGDRSEDFLRYNWIESNKWIEVAASANYLTQPRGNLYPPYPCERLVSFQTLPGPKLWAKTPLPYPCVSDLGI